MSEKKEAQSGATVSGQMKSESLSEQIIQDFFASTPNLKLNALADAAPELLAACKAQHEAIDRLFARLIASQDDFMPTRSGQPWEAAQLGFAAISKAEGASSIPTSESATASERQQKRKGDRFKGEPLPTISEDDGCGDLPTGMEL
jgi:hypothetical protein